MPSVRSRLVGAKLRSRFRENPASASAVAWWTIASGSASSDGPAHGARVEQIEHDRLRAERPDPLGVARRPGGPDHLVAALDQLRDEPGADRTARPRHEHSHRISPSVAGWRLHPYDRGRPRSVTAVPPLELERQPLQLRAVDDHVDRHDPPADDGEARDGHGVCRRARRLRRRAR